MLFSCEMLCWLQFYRTGRAGWVAAGFLVNGLGCANHLLAVLTMVPACIVCLCFLWQRRLKYRVLILCAICWLIGAGPYEYLIYQELAAGRPVAEVINSALFGNTWRADVLNCQISWKLLVYAGGIVLFNFPTITILLAGCGVAYLAKSASWFGKFIVGAGALHLAFVARYTITDQYTFFITTVVFVAILIGVGAWRAYLWRPKLGYAAVLLAALPVAVYWQLPNVIKAMSLEQKLERKLWKRTIPYRDEMSYFLQPWAGGYDGPERFAREVFDSVAGDSIVVIDGTALRPLRYLQLAEGLRQDVRINFTPSENRQFEAEGGLRRFDDTLARHAVYVLPPVTGHYPRWLVENYRFVQEGIMYRVVGRKSVSADG